jgi:hypothetical protein
MMVGLAWASFACDGLARDINKGASSAEREVHGNRAAVTTDSDAAAATEDAGAVPNHDPTR